MIIMIVIIMVMMIVMMVMMKFMVVLALLGGMPRRMTGLSTWRLMSRGTASIMSLILMSPLNKNYLKMPFVGQFILLYI